MRKPLKPGTYVMEPMFIKNKERRKRLTRTVVVKGCQHLGTAGEFIETIEATTLEPLWKAGEEGLRERAKYRWTLVIFA